MKGKPKKDILGHEEEDELTEEKKKKETFKPASPFYLTLFVFLLALSVRLVFLLFFTEMDKPSVGDVWHHWQIAYLTKTIGFKQGFLQLWGFRGMEYYWGLLHPLVLIVAFTISRSVSIVVPQIVSTLFGAGVITLVFLIVARHFNKKTAFVSALFLSLMPITVFHDTLGLQESLGLFFLLLGIYLFPGHAFFAGFSWMLAGMVRAEFWLFGAGLLLAVFLRERNLDRKVITLFGFGIPCIFYMKYMLDHTGNPIYPIYWNYLAVVAGEWSTKNVELAPEFQSIELACRILAISLFISGLIVLWKKFKSYLFLLLGLSSLVFTFSILGFGIYLRGFKYVGTHPDFIDKIWIGKLFAFPWGFLGILTVIFLFYLLPKKIGKSGTLIGSLIFLVGLGATQLIWPSIDYHYLHPPSDYEFNRKTAEFIASQYTGKGKIILPTQSEFISYFLVYNEGISGDKQAASFYSPFYYYEGGDPFAEWDIFREEIIEWLQKENAELFVFEANHKKHKRMFELEEGKLFEFLGKVRGFMVLKVKTNED